MSIQVKGFQIRSYGGPEVLEWSDLELPQLEANQVRVRHRAVGVNFIDNYHRRGLYPMPLPGRIGVEASGLIEAVGSEVVGFEVGDRVSYCMSALGAYAEAHVVPESSLLKLPESIGFELAAAVTLKGLTAAFLLHSLRSFNAKETILVYAAAGGVGQILSQWASAKGLRVIGVVRGAAKVEQALTAGCDSVIDSEVEDIAERARALTQGKGVAAVFDSVGADTLESSLDSIAKRGWLISYGNSSGPAPAVAPLTLASKGSLVLTRPGLGDFISTRSELDYLSGLLFSAIEQGLVKVNIGHRFPLEQAAQAQRLLESRLTTGSTVLLVE